MTHDLALPPQASAPVAVAAIPPAAPAPRAAAVPFRFTGEAGEFFRIWIVNLALTVLTLGIYSAWAKVRAERWFYGNTLLHDAPFEYLADPIPILKGRLIAAAALGAYLLTANLAPLWEPALLLALLVVMPWIIVRALAFRAHNSAWKSLRFRFVGRTRNAYVEFLALYVPVMLSLGLAFPWVQWRQRRFVVDHHRFGGIRFFMTAPLGAFYAAWGLALVGMLLAGLAAFAVAVGGSALSQLLLGPEVEPSEFMLWIMIPMLVVLYGGYFCAFVYAQVRIANAVWNGTALGGHGFRSTLRTDDMLRLYLTNTLAILATVGLAIPWAQVRMARYRASHLELLPAGDLDAFAAEAGAAQDPTAQELGDFFGLDLGF